VSTYFIDDETKARAWALAKTPTARRLLVGSEDWSLASLKGKAAAYGGSYARSRSKFLTALAEAGLQPVTLYPRALRGRRIVVI
jgi:hypothetical protein